MLVVLGCFLELSRFRASLSRFLTRLSSLSSRFSHSKSFFLFSNRFSASFRRFISFCSRRVRYLRHKNKNITIYNQQQQKNNTNKKQQQQKTNKKKTQKGKTKNLARKLRNAYTYSRKQTSVQKDIPRSTKLGLCSISESLAWRKFAEADNFKSR